MVTWDVDTAADGKTEFLTSTDGGVFVPFAVTCGARYVWLLFVVLALHHLLCVKTSLWKYRSHLSTLTPPIRCREKHPQPNTRNLMPKSQYDSWSSSADLSVSGAGLSLGRLASHFCAASSVASVAAP
jgi:hypothetical protein